MKSGPGCKVQGVVSGPVTDTLKIRAAASYFDTDGHLKNADTVGRRRPSAMPTRSRTSTPAFTALYTPTDNFTADLRLSTDLLNTRALYYIIPPFGSPNFNNPNYTSQPINLNNSGQDARKIYDAALKLTYDWTDGGTFTSITGYNTVWEILTGDGYRFDPFGHIRTIFFDFDQSQFLDVKTFTPGSAFTSSADAGSATSSAPRSSTPTASSRPATCTTSPTRASFRSIATRPPRRLPISRRARSRFWRTRRSSSPGRSISTCRTASPTRSNCR